MSTCKRQEKWRLIQGKDLNPSAARNLFCPTESFQAFTCLHFCMPSLFIFSVSYASIFSKCREGKKGGGFSAC